MKLNFNKIFLLFLIKLLLQVKAIEYKLREAKPHKHRCAYQYKNENNEEEGKWILKPSATACPNELDIVWPEEQTNNLLLIGESTHDNKQNKKGRKRKREEETQQQQQTLCQIIFGKKDGEEQRLRSEACDNEWIQPLARKCRKECGTCCELPEFQCEDKAHSENHRDKYQLKQHSFSCYTIKNIQNKCQKTSVWYPTLSEHCQSTCGLCELERKKEENRRREESWDDNDVSIEKKRKNKMKIPRSIFNVLFCFCGQTGIRKCSYQISKPHLGKRYLSVISPHLIFLLFPLLFLPISYKNATFSFPVFPLFLPKSYKNITGK
uniref:ShKT domain-containing protein n=1 Tax=Meloidogyne enterolobii TaxID=390850 RepID=A0A6V7XAS6_MELEN|nr:unnamed protein product [Meloidogyne enterolobii]